jgi:uncharacterized coiled-coil DUF342 family protein
MFLPTTHQSLQKKTNNILSVFSKTVDELLKVNNEAHAKVNSNKEIINDLTNENTSLQTMTEQNNKVITNIKSLLK